MSDDKNSVRLPEAVRDDLRDFADERELTYSEAVQAILPDNAEPLNLGGTTWIEIDTPAHSRLDALTGEGVDYSDTIRHFLKRHQKMETNHE